MKDMNENNLNEENINEDIKNADIKNEDIKTEDTENVNIKNEENINEDSVNENNRNDDATNEHLENVENEADIKKSKKSKEKKKLSLNIKNSFQSRKFKSGAYSTVISVVVIAMILIVNLIVGELDLKVDLSSEALYTLTDETKDIANNVKDDVTIYYIVSDGNEVDQVKEIVNKYGSLSNKIKVEMKDPVLYPTFTSQYVTESVTQNSVIVVNNTTDTFKYVPYSDMLEYSYDSSYNAQVSGIDVEGQITSAIQYVTSSDLPTIYTLEGHNEASLGSTIESALKKQNVTINSVNLLSADSIPEDCSLLLINGPLYDFSEDEVTKVKDYLGAGGNAIILADYTTEEMPNFNGLLEYYGISLADGIVIEGENSNFMSGNPAYLIPTINSHDITSAIRTNNKSVVVPVSKGITKLDTLRSGLTIDSLLTTSDKAFSKIDVNSSSYEKSGEDITGPFDLGVLITDTYNEVESKLLVFGSSYLIDDGMASYSQLGNADLFVSAVNYLTEQDNSLSIPVRSVDTNYLTLTSAQVNFWGAIVIVIIPLVIIAIGIVVTVRRRRR